MPRFVVLELLRLQESNLERKQLRESAAPASWVYGLMHAACLLVVLEQVQFSWRVLQNGNPKSQDPKTKDLKTLNPKLATKP